MKILETKKGEQLKHWIEGQHIFFKGYRTNTYFLIHEIIHNEVHKVRFGFEKFEPK